MNSIGTQGNKSLKGQCGHTVCYLAHSHYRPTIDVAAMSVCFSSEYVVHNVSYLVYVHYRMVYLRIFLHQ